MIRSRLLAAKFSRSTISRVLPAEPKHTEKSNNGYARTMQSSLPQTPELYKTEELDKYPRSFLVKIIHYLEQKQTIGTVVHEVKAAVAAKPTVAATADNGNNNGNNKHYYSPQLDVSSPRQICIQESLDILKEKQQSLTFEDLIRQVCQQNPIVAEYIGDKYLTKHNSKLVPILQQLLSNQNVMRIGIKPIVLSYKL